MKNMRTEWGALTEGFNVKMFDSQRLWYKKSYQYQNHEYLLFAIRNTHWQIFKSLLIRKFMKVIFHAAKFKPYGLTDFKEIV